MELFKSEGRQVLVLAPVGRDAALLQSLLTVVGYTSLTEADGVEAPLEEIDLVVLTLEALEMYTLERLLARLGRQPTWSDLPLVLLGEQEVLVSSDAVRRIHIQHNLTLVARPVEPAVLLSAVAAAHRDRERQFQVRGLLRRVVAQNLQLEEEIAQRNHVEESLQQVRDELAALVEQKSNQLQQTSVALVREMGDHEQTRRQLDTVRRQIHFGREEEWMRLSQILYDETIQHLSGLLYAIKALGGQPEAMDREERIDLIHTQLVQVIQHLRMLANERRASVFREFGLAKAMRAYAEHFQGKETPRVAFLLTDRPSPLPQEVEWELYRIYQQALQNAVAHSQARAILVRLAYNSDEVLLDVEDDGKGFSMVTDLAALVRSGHLGIASMIERAQGIGGSLQVLTHPNQGTRIRVAVPHAQAREEQQPSQAASRRAVRRNGYLLRSL